MSPRIEQLFVAKCPKCGKELLKPDKSLKNSFFYIEAYSCDSCGYNFKVINR